MKKRKQGFGVIEIILIIVIIALIATVGWLAFDRITNKDSAPDDKTDSDSHRVSKKKAAATPTTKEVAVSIEGTTTATKISLKVPERWSVVTPKYEAADSAIGTTINGHSYQIQFLVAADYTSTDGVTHALAHLASDYAESGNAVLKTISKSDKTENYLVKSTAMNDVILKTCSGVENIACYPTKYTGGTPLIVRLHSADDENAQAYGGLSDFDSDSTKKAIDDFAIIAESI